MFKRHSHLQPLKRRAAQAVCLVAVSLYAGMPGCADDGESIDFFNFKNSDFFAIDDKRTAAERKRKKEEEREDEQRRKLDEKESNNRPTTNPKHNWQESFVDTDFGMHTFQDLDINDLNSLAAMRPDLRDDDRKRSDDDDDVDKTDRDDYRKRMKDDDYRRFRDLTAPIAGMLHDWVPSKPDRGQNGAFTMAPDNGSVVPYKLNGWVEIQRKLPWEAEP